MQALGAALCGELLRHQGRFITKGGGLTGQKQDLCGAAGAQRSELCEGQWIRSGWRCVFIW